jgi:membrane-bound serine protease (ClpP class)
MSSPLLAVCRRLCSVTVLVFVVLGLTATFASAQTEILDPDEDLDEAETVVEILPFDGFLDPPVAAQIRDVLDQAAAEGSDLVILQMDSPSGVSVDLEELLGEIRDSEVPVAALVGPLGTRPVAGGAAGLLWLAADARAVSSDAEVGALLPADLAAHERDDTELARTLLADAGGDDALLDELLTGPVGAERLVEAGAATLTAEGLEPLLADLDGTTVVTAAGEVDLELLGEGVGVRFHSLGLVRRLLHAATTAPFIYLLLVVGLGMLLFEVFQPGFGVAGLAGLITVGIGAFGLFVLPVVWWAVALVILGLILYAIDTAVAGFGFVTVAATAAFGFGSWHFYDAEALQLPLWLVISTTLTALIFFVFVMTVVLRAQAGPEGVSVDELVGRLGTVRSVLNPEGHVYIDGALWRARWTGDTRRAKVGTPVRVHGIDGPVVLVEPFDPEAATAGAGRAGGDEGATSPE